MVEQLPTLTENPFEPLPTKPVIELELPLVIETPKEHGLDFEVDPSTIAQPPPLIVREAAVPEAPAYATAMGVVLGETAAIAVIFVPKSLLVPKPPVEPETH